MDCSDYPKFDAHECIQNFEDRASGLGGTTREALELEIARIPDRLDVLLAQSDHEDLPPTAVADRIARSLIGRAESPVNPPRPKIA
jgi:hypothetical protein